MILAILFRSSLSVPGLASTNQAPLLAINNSSTTKKLSRRSVAALPSMFSPTPGTARPRKSKLNTAAGSQVLVTGDQDRAEDATGEEADTAAGGQTLANPTPEKKQRSVATPKQKVARSAKQAAASANKNGDNANSFHVFDEIV